jgi:hypothetical protein
VAIVEAVEVVIALSETSIFEPVTASMSIRKLVTVTTFNTITITLSKPWSTHSGAAFARHSTTVNLCATRATAMHSRAATAADRPATATAAHVGYKRN